MRKATIHNGPMGSNLQNRGVEIEITIKIKT